MTFASLGLCEPLLNALTQQGYTQPSPIQQQAIAPVLAGRDVMAAAQTGTGKTAAFTLPLLHKLSLDGKKVAGNKVRALVLTPTRELAAQVADSVTKYGAELRLNYNVVFGGVKINPQMMKLRKGSDVLIATPGRLLDLHQQNAVAFDQLETLVLDEADRMLDMGFIHDVKKILRLLPKKRQNLLFSATFSDEVRSLAQQFVVNPVEVSVTPANTTVDRIDQCIHPVDKNKKTRLLVHLISSENWTQVLVFCRTKHGANRLTNDLIKKGISAAAIHGNKSQNVRTKALADFKQNNIQVLVATDIAARGIDIQQLPHVVNYDLPNVAEDYVHRIGRTGRAGQSGEAVSLVCLAESEQLAIIERFIQLAIPRREVEGYAPSQPLPEVALKPAKPKKPKKPKKHRQGQPEEDSGRQRAKGEQQERGHGGRNSGKNSGKNNGRNSGRNSGKGGGNSGQPSPASDAKEQGQKKNNPAKPRRRRPAARGNGAGNKANGANSNSVRSGEAKPNSHNN